MTDEREHGDNDETPDPGERDGETEYTAVLDRFEDDLAVLLLEADGAVVDQRVVPVGTLPDAARHEDAVVVLTLADDEVVDVDYRPEATDDRIERARDRFDRLSDRPPQPDEDDEAW